MVTAEPFARSFEAQAKADVRRSAEKAGKSAYSALKDGNLEKAQEKSRRSTALYADSGFAVPKKYMVVFRDIESAVAKVNAHLVYVFRNQLYICLCTSVAWHEIIWMDVVTQVLR